VKISFIGCGSWGGALGQLASKNGFSVLMWHRNSEVVEKMTKARSHYILPQMVFGDSVQFTNDLEKTVSYSDILVLSTPSQTVRGVLESIGGIDQNKIIVNIAKGIETGTLMTVSDIIIDVKDFSYSNIVTLSGPSHAEEVMSGFPTTLVSASKNPDAAMKIQKIFSNNNMRIYSSSDIRGVELGGAMKNVIAIAAGISDGIGYGDNSKAALMTRGIREIARLGNAMGAEAGTFSGLSGIGDLIVTCLSQHSRNRRVGQQIGEGKILENILSEMKMVAEGVETAKSLHRLIEKYQVEMPISEAIYQILFHNADPKESVYRLMTRELSSEL